MYRYDASFYSDNANEDTDRLCRGKGCRNLRLKVIISGIVQGVGFRPFVYRIAIKHGLTGYVRNRGDAMVEILLEGREESINKFLKDVIEKKPPIAQIHKIEKRKLEGREKNKRFRIKQSTKIVENSGSIIPPDIAICSECLKELKSPDNHRFNYFFITCVNCGPRYTIIEKLPYDRENTTMRDFPMCALCYTEYQDILDRRFHAQTVACPKCGPEAYLTTNDGQKLYLKDPIAEAGKLISEGYLVAVKGLGGFHLAASTVLDEPLARLRRVKHRRQKPFAVMAPNLKTARTFAIISPMESKLLTSYARPIVLLRKSRHYFLSDLVAPGLHNIGVMLPYTGLHFILFSQVADPAFVMTSANPPNEPIIVDEREAIRKLRETADYFLFHNRRIAHRCDDSVVRVHECMPVHIRRSRGYAPAPIFLRFKAEKCAVGLGGELNNTICIILDDKAFLSPHIGDVENVETRDFLERTVHHMIHLTNAKVGAVACDMHPRFITTQLARDLTHRYGWDLIEVQHHQAHIAGLMAEHGVDQIIGICCDGYGYGLDGGAWGGEILLCERDSRNFKRLSHLQEQPFVGADLATRYPLRMAANILYGQVNIEEWLLSNEKYFPHGREEVYVLLHQLEHKKDNLKTSSCGRVLDAISAILGVCFERTYEGEPAMKLESIAVDGKLPFKVKPRIENGILNTTFIVSEIFENREKFHRADLAYLAHAYLAEGLASIAIEKAFQEDIEHIGFTGGVAYNQIITSIMRRIIKKAGLKFLTHQCVPPGDGGLSAGQAILAAKNET
ncbi:MAG: carbamoyltransferase HypF [Nitrososphaerota archaeon]|nr:carbamoyltransferase HypF [Nitrososphaerota archaeon]